MDIAHFIVEQREDTQGPISSTAPSRNKPVTQASCLRRNRCPCRLEACATSELALYCQTRLSGAGDHGEGDRSKHQWGRTKDWQPRS